MSTGLFPSGSALWAAARSVGESTAGEKLLLACGEGEFLVAIAAIQCLVSQYFSLSFLPQSGLCVFLYCALLPLSNFSGSDLS